MVGVAIHAASLQEFVACIAAQLLYKDSGVCV